MMDLYSILPRGVNFYDGKTLQRSYDHYVNELRDGFMNFDPEKVYMEVNHERVCESFWNALNDYDGFLLYDFAEYRYLVLE